MFVRSIRPARVSIAGSTIALAANLASRAIRDVRTRAAEIGDALHSKDGGKAMQALDRLHRDLDACHLLVGALREHADAYNEAVRALDGGDAPAGQLADLVEACLDAYGHADKLRQTAPDAVVCTDRFAEALAALKETEGRLRAACEADTGNLAKAERRLRPLAAKAAFAFGSIPELLARQIDHDLPQDWQAEIPKTIKSPDALQKRLQKRLEDEAKAQADAKREAGEAIDAATLRADLAGAHHE